MMTRGLLFVYFTLICAVVAIAQDADTETPAEAELRQWTDTTGKFQIDAKFVEFVGNQVTLQRADGSMLNVPLSRLSSKDRAFVRAELRRRREADKPKDDPPEKSDAPAVNDRGLGILPLNEPRVYIHVEGMPAPDPQHCVGFRWTDPTKKAQLLVN